MHFSLQSRMLALGGAGVFVAVGVLSLLSRASLLDLERQVALQRAHTADIIAGTVSGAVDDDMRVLTTAAMAPHTNLEDGDDLPERATLAGLHHHGRLWSALFFFDQAGAAVVSDPADERATLPAAASALAASAVAQQRPLLSDVFVDLEGGHRVLCVVPFRGMGGQNAGAAGFTIDVPSRALADLLRTPERSGQLRVDVIDSAGGIVAATSDAEVAPSTAAGAVVPGTPWRVRIAEAGPDPFAPIARFRQQSLWLAPLFTALAMLLAWGIAHSVRRPLARLTASAERIAGGNLERPVDVRGTASGGREISRLAAALERMRASLQASMTEVEEANRVLEQRVAERTIELGRVNEQLQDRERMRQHLLRKVISAQEDERKRIARELHDETSQSLAALGMGLDTTIARAESADVRQRLAETRRLVDRMNTELHRMIVNLRPSVLDDLGLAAAIEWLAERQLAAAGIAVRCELTDLDVRLPSETETAVFRAVQEAITNVSRHAGAESVLIQAAADERLLTIEIEDDGIGFDPSSAGDGVQSMRGAGLLGMRERIGILGGTLTVDSDPGGGTRVLMQVPLAAGQPAAQAAVTS